MAKIETLQDDFSTGTTPDGTRWPSVTATRVTVGGGVATITTAANASEYNVIQSATAYDATGSYFLAKVVPATPAGPNLSAQTYMGVGPDDNNWVALFLNGTTLTASYKLAGVETTTNLGTYNATTMAYWRVRFYNGLVYYGWSADGATWTESANARRPSWAYTSVKATLMLGTWAATDPAATATFDKVNLYASGGFGTNKFGTGQFNGVGQAIAPDDSGAAITLVSDNPTITETDAAAPDDSGAAITVASDNPTATEADAAAPDDSGAPLPVAQDAPTGGFNASAAPADGVPIAVTLDDTTWASQNDTQAFPDDSGATVAVVSDPPFAGEIDGAFPNDDVTVAVVSDDVENVAFASAATPDGLPVPATQDNPVGAFAEPLPLDDGQPVGVASDGPAVTFAGTVQVGDGPTVPVVSDDIEDAAVVFGAAPDGGPVVTVAVGDAPDIGILYFIYPDSLADIGVTPAGDVATTGVWPPTYTKPPVDKTRWTLPPVPLHLLGIGPTDANVPWRGAPNHGVTGGPISRPSLPAVQLPEAQSKSFTLRLDGGAEARADHTVTRDRALIVEQNLTDLWWWRRDGATGALDPIGRFNAATVDLSSNGPEVTLSVTWSDYRVLLENRMVLTYQDATIYGSQWPIGTLITDILRYAIPTNVNIDLTAVQAATAAPLGKTIAAYTLAPGTTIADAMKALRAISTTQWDWWVEMNDITSLPVLSFAANGRGADRGVTLVDIDGIHGPVASWTLQGRGDQYANTLFFAGSNGNGLVYTLTGEIATYGEYDAQVADSSVDDTKSDALAIAAKTKIGELADRTPSFTVVLKPGFWQGRQHIDIGDWVTLDFRLGAETVAGKYRVTQIDGEVDASGAETITLAFGNPRLSRDARSRYSALAKLVRKLPAYKNPQTAISNVADPSKPVHIT